MTDGEADHVDTFFDALEHLGEGITVVLSDLAEPLPLLEQEDWDWSQVRL